ncbi:MAG TPA: helix-turn-helix domain-containing protein [Burkholderiaceae bacterium]|nr:helix-turn-helix domain-containing protein [Burkholderiaceae bacterium]
MSGLHSISTDDVPACERLAWWGERIWGLIGRLHSDAYGDPMFTGRIEHGDVGYMTVCRLQASRHRVVRTPTLIRHSDRPFLKVVAQLKGHACFEQHGRKVWLAPGDWSVYDTTEAYTVSNPDAVEQLVLLLPKDQLMDPRVSLPEAMVRRFPGSVGVARLAYEMMNGVFHELPQLPPQAGVGVADALSRLLQLAMLEKTGKPTAVTQRELLRDRIKQYVQAHLRDPELTIDRIAKALNCSKRSLHAVFELEETTLADYIQAQRLQACRRDLLSEEFSGSSITEIALSWGYNSPSHFSRVFKQHFGASPSELRASALSASR